MFRVAHELRSMPRATTTRASRSAGRYPASFAALTRATMSAPAAARPASTSSAGSLSRLTIAVRVVTTPPRRSDIDCADTTDPLPSRTISEAWLVAARDGLVVCGGRDCQLTMNATPRGAANASPLQRPRTSRGSPTSPSTPAEPDFGSTQSRFRATTGRVRPRSSSGGRSGTTLVGRSRQPSGLGLNEQAGSRSRLSL